MEYKELVLALMTGIGLSAACGFRIFVPLLLLSLASLYGFVHLSQGFEWISGYFAIIVFTSATILEILAYYIPWLDNIMDSIAAPVSMIAGTIATASVITDIPPSLKWIIAIIAGGGVAGLLQGSTTLLRAKSSLFTGGSGNAILATIELAGSVVIALLAIVLPVIGIILVLMLAVYLVFKTLRAIVRKMRSNG